MCDPDPPDVWQTYKDYLKRKRDYKREWRRTKKPIPPKSVRVPATRRPQPPRTRIRAATTDDKDTTQPPIIVQDTLPAEVEGPLIDSIIVDEDQSDLTDFDPEQEQEQEQPEEEANRHAKNEQERTIMYENLDDEQFHDTFEISSEDVYDEPDADSEFQERWNEVTCQLMSVTDNDKRCRYLTLIEGLVAEACRHETYQRQRPTSK